MEGNLSEEEASRKAEELKGFLLEYMKEKASRKRCL